MKHSEQPLDQSLEILKAHFALIEDPRVNRNKEHPLVNIILMAVTAVICGANHWTEVELFCRHKRQFFAQFLDLKSGIPSHDTFGRVFAALDTESFGESFTRWAETCFGLPIGRTINIDGKTMRGSGKKKGTHLVSAWVNELGISFAQKRVDDKSNEITAIPELLKMLDLTDCLVTIDAMGCQTDIAAQIIDQKGDYILALKSNQRNLREEVRHLFEVRPANETAETIEKDHGRIEHRRIEVISELDWIDERELQKWKGLKSVVRVMSSREIGGKKQRKTRYFIASVADDPRRMLARIRGHWAIENSLHWSLDVGFGEDHSQVRMKNAPANFSLIRKMALNLLKQDKTYKVGIESKRKAAGWDEPYLVKLLNRLVGFD
jgi:predicted transposase YbfD/YdcC